MTLPRLTLTRALRTVACWRDGERRRFSQDGASMPDAREAVINAAGCSDVLWIGG
jgi:hypothetical protein